MGDAMTKDLNVGTQAKNLALRKNIDMNFHNLGFGRNFLDVRPQV